ATLCDPTGAEVAATKVHGDGHVRRTRADGRVDHVGVDGGQAVGVVTAFAQQAALLRIAKIREVHFVELQVAATRIGKGLHGGAIGEAEVAVEFVHLGIDRGVDGAAAAAKVEHARRRNRHLRNGARVFAEKTEVIEHGVVGEGDLPGDTQPFRLRLDSAL